MIPTDPERIDRLAAEYVLGTLRGAARQRFERWRRASAPIQERCRFWEERLLPLARSITPVPPPAHVWRQISERLPLEPSRPVPSPVTRRGRPFQGVRLALAASLLLAAGLGALYYGEAPGRLTREATLSAPGGGTAWTVELHAPRLKGAQLVVRTGTLPARPAHRDYELWALPARGAPVSLGVLPASGGARHVLTPQQLRALAGSTQVAVSLEPAGGSPIGAPTGPVVLTAPLRTLS